MIEHPAPSARRIALLLAALVCAAAPAVAQGPGNVAASSDPPPSIEDKVAAMERLDGLFSLYWDAAAGTLYMEIARFDEDVLYVRGLAAGLGSNDIGLDRGQGGDNSLVRFERVGPKILMLQPNMRYRADSDNADERIAVEEAFAQSVLWGFTVAAETDGRALVDMTGFLLRDTHDIAVTLQPAQYRLDSSRSVISRAHTKAFPKNVIMNATLTFTTQGDAGGRAGSGAQAGPGGGFGRGSLSAVTPSTEAVTVRTHHQFVKLPDDGYERRTFDPRSGSFGPTYQDYAVPLGTPLAKRFVNRHRLEKVDPGAEVSDAVEPIVYYLDRGTPEPIRSALLDGARWWNQAYEAAGYRDAFRVEMLPEGADNMDVRYNIIQWVHRSTRGWSYGGSVSDPRSGEIIKGRVTLGSLRVRQDYLIAEGLLSPYENGTETPPELAEWALARLRQLSAHEVGHTLGFGHNYYASSLGRISVMDYPHPLIELTDDGELDYSAVYDDKIGEWDKVAVNYAYQDFPPGADEAEELRAILDEAWERDVIYMTNQDMSAQPRVHWWANGDDPAAELNRMMAVRRHALDRFGDNAITLGAPLATIEEALVPLYLHHRYQVQATASAIGGSNYHYALRGDGHGNATGAVPGSEQMAALEALLATLQPSELAVPRSVLTQLPPRPSGYRSHRELFPRYTGMTFDAITPAVVAAQHVAANILDPSRTARMVEQHALDSSLPGLVDVLDHTLHTVFTMQSGDGYEQEIIRAVQRAIVEQVMSLAADAPMPQVRAIATSRLATLSSRIATRLGEADEMIGPSQAHVAMLERDVERFLTRPAAAYAPARQQAAPPGAPIGQPAPSWLDSSLMSTELPPVGSMLDTLFPAGPTCSWGGR